MAGFGGSTGVSKEYVDGKIAQSTANFDAVVAQSIGSNGGYIKYNSGLMFAYGTNTVSIALSQIETSGIYTGSTQIDLPQAFYTSDYVINAVAQYGTGYRVPAGFTPSTASRITGQIYDFYQRNGNFVIRWMAVGRWK